MEPIRIRQEPPERGRRTTTLAAHGSCCCCCCLHALAGLLGAAIASQVKIERSLRDPRFDLDAQKKARNQRRAVTTYWLTFVVLTILSTTQFFLFGRGEVALVLLFLGLPLVQLGASIVSLAVIYFKYPEEDRPDIYRMLGRITAKAFLWAFITGVLMYGALLLLLRIR